MTRFALRPRALRDLDEIWTFGESRWDAVQAARYLREIQGAFLVLADDPQIGRAVDNVRAGYRRYRVGSHLIFYRIEERGIDIVRILHERMNHDAAL